MSIQVAIRHHTKYIYDKSVKLSPQVIRLRPAPHARSPIRGYSLKIEPEEHFINWQLDPFGNYQARIVVPERTSSFTIDVEVLVDMVTINPFDFFLEEYAEEFPFEYEPQLKKELMPYLEIKESGPLLMEWVEKAKALLPLRSVDFLVSINQQICEAINYSIRLEPGIQSSEETLQKAIGSCRDSAWLLVQLFRHVGLAARFVSGYLVQLKADEKPIDGPAGTEEDFTDLHAWAEVYLPGAGWVGLDATSGLFAGEGHIPLACTPDPASAAPVTGMTEPCNVSFEYKNVVERVLERPRVTKPYTEEQWQNILSLGDYVEEVLDDGDVRLTMGGEPTFVSVDDMESDQWNEGADGKDKRRIGYELVNKLKNHFGSQGFLHLGQGKWYPGEPLPRWQYAAYWRKDQKPIWKDEKFLADPNKEYHFQEEDAKKFIQRLAYYLGVAETNCLPAYEDVFYFLWEEGNLPVNIDPLNIDPKDKLERRTLAELLDHGLNLPKGYVLPVKYNHASSLWESCRWQFTRKHLFLIPGNSAIGMRLPLDRLPYMSPGQIEEPVEADPLEKLPDLPDEKKMENTISQRQGQENELTLTSSKLVVEEESEKPQFQPAYQMQTIKTALCIEPRGGILYVFMPPLETFDIYQDLLYTIDKTASDLEIPVIIEGYQPPFDNRVEKLVVAPDPGVIEVNIHPATKWRDIVSNYDILFDLARSCRLGTEKFMLDGKHTGTGGGNHVTLGGKTPADSPFLRQKKKKKKI
ncbi:MAG: transglutaminase family protein [Bacteroidetes bacterium]|nr:transglutaminase family protein [Bacteroidota bacterium]